MTVFRKERKFLYDSLFEFGGKTTSVSSNSQHPESQPVTQRFTCAIPMDKSETEVANCRSTLLKSSSFKGGGTTASVNSTLQQSESKPVTPSFTVGICTDKSRKKVSCNRNTSQRRCTFRASETSGNPQMPSANLSSSNQVFIFSAPIGSSRNKADGSGIALPKSFLFKFGESGSVNSPALSTALSSDFPRPRLRSLPENSETKDDISDKISTITGPVIKFEGSTSVNSPEPPTDPLSVPPSLSCGSLGDNSNVKDDADEITPLTTPVIKFEGSISVNSPEPPADPLSVSPSLGCDSLGDNSKVKDDADEITPLTSSASEFGERTASMISGVQNPESQPVSPRSTFTIPIDKPATEVFDSRNTSPKSLSFQFGETTTAVNSEFQDPEPELIIPSFLFAIPNEKFKTEAPADENSSFEFGERTASVHSDLQPVSQPVTPRFTFAIPMDKSTTEVYDGRNTLPKNSSFEFGERTASVDSDLQPAVSQPVTPRFTFAIPMDKPTTEVYDGRNTSPKTGCEGNKLNLDLEDKLSSASETSRGSHGILSNSFTLEKKSNHFWKVRSLVEIARDAVQLRHGSVEDIEENRIPQLEDPLLPKLGCEKDATYKSQILDDMSPSQLILYSLIAEGLGKTIDYLSEVCLRKHNESLEAMRLTSFEVGTKERQILERRFQILMRQGLLFQHHINHLKVESTKRLYALKAVDVQRLYEETLREVEFECRIFSYAPFIYAYRTELLSSVKQHQVTIVSADACYSLSEMILFFLHQDYPSDVILSCESDADAAVLLATRYQTFEGSNSSNLIDCGIESWVKRTKDNKIIFMSVSELYHKGTMEYFLSNCKFVIVRCALNRSLETDIVLKQLRSYLKENTALKTILLLSPLDDCSKFVSYFSSCTVCTHEFPDIVYPVQTVWLTDSVSIGKFNTSAIIDTALAIHALNGPGNVLVFLPSPHNVRSVTVLLSQRLVEYAYSDAVCIPLSGDSSGQSLQEFSQLHENSSKRKFYLATTGLADLFSLPFVIYVIDAGMYVNPTYLKNGEHFYTLISKQKAKQLKRHTGHHKKGICYRLYCKQDYLYKMPQNEMPEVLYKNPHEIIARMFGHSPKMTIIMDFVQNLSKERKKDILMSLRKVNAIEGNRLTAFGEQIVKLPFLPRYSKLIILGIQQSLGYEAIVLVSFLLVNKPVFIDCAGNKELRQLVELSKLHYRLHDSDLFTFLNIYREFSSVDESRDSWCKMRGLDFSVLFSVMINEMLIRSHVCHTLNKDIYPEIKLKEENDWFDLRELLLNCFADRLCVYTGHYRYGYRFLGNNCLTQLHPTSVIQKNNLPEFVIFGNFKNSSESIITGVTSVPRELVLSATKSHLSMFKETQLLEQRLKPIVIENIGIARIKRIFLGKNEKRLVEIEDEIKKMAKCDLIVIEPSVENCSVTLYVPAEATEVAETIIRDILEMELDSLFNEKETSIVKLEKQTHTVPVHVTWEKGATTCQLVSSTCDAKSSETKRSPRVIQPHKSIKESIKLRWPRRICKGFGYVSVKEEYFAAFRQRNSITIESNGKRVEIEVSGKMNQLCISGLSVCMTAAELQDGIEAVLKTLFFRNIKADNATVVNQEPYETTEEELDFLKKQIFHKCCKLLCTNLVTVTIPKPQNMDLFMEALITVDKVNVSSTEIAKLLNGHLKIGGHVTEAKPCFTCTSTCSKKLYQHLVEKIAVRQQIFKILHSGYIIVATDGPCRSLMTLTLGADNPFEIAYLKSSIQKYLEGENTLDFTCMLYREKFHKFFTHEGHLLLRALEQQTSIHIIDDYESKTLLLYRAQYDSNVILDMYEYFNNKAIIKKVSFSKERDAELMLKAIIKIYGIDLKRFAYRFNLKSAEMFLEEEQVILQGDFQNIANALLELEYVISTALPDVPKKVLVSSEVCCICETPPMQPSIRLEHCTHLYCIECLKGLITNSKLPLVCCAENCGKELLLSDIHMGLDYKKVETEKLLRLSMKDFISKNSKHLKYCPAPGCSMYYDESLIVGNKWNCQLCHNDICIKCSAVFHYGYTCEMYQGMQKDSDFPVKVWMDEKTAERKQCPSCQTGIEKYIGCNHMQCTSCQAHFCWLCLQVFPTPELVYDHQPYCPQNQTP